jgi:hypothetical protein
MTERYSTQMHEDLLRSARKSGAVGRICLEATIVHSILPYHLECRSGMATRAVGDD